MASGQKHAATSTPTLLTETLPVPCLVLLQAVVDTPHLKPMPPEEAAACGSVPQEKSQYELDRVRNTARRTAAEESLRLQSLGAELGPVVLAKLLGFLVQS